MVIVRLPAIDVGLCAGRGLDLHFLAINRLTEQI